jgi:hypothetical protein
MENRLGSEIVCVQVGPGQAPTSSSPKGTHHQKELLQSREVIDWYMVTPMDVTPPVLLLNNVCARPSQVYVISKTSKLSVRSLYHPHHRLAVNLSNKNISDLAAVFRIGCDLKITAMHTSIGTRHTADVDNNSA